MVVPRIIAHFGELCKVYNWLRKEKKRDFLIVQATYAAKGGGIKG